MKKFAVTLAVVLFLGSFNTTVYSKTINEADTELCETFKFALLSSLRDPVDKAITQIYKDDKKVPDVLSWSTYDTKILKIKQIYGVGGLYELTLKVRPYYGAHNTYGIDEIVVNTRGKLIRYKHIKTYP